LSSRIRQAVKAQLRSIGRPAMQTHTTREWLTLSGGQVNNRNKEHIPMALGWMRGLQDSFQVVVQLATCAAKK